MKLKCLKILGLEGTYDRICFDALCGFVSEINYSFVKWLEQYQVARAFSNGCSHVTEGYLEIDVRL